MRKVSVVLCAVAMLTIGLRPALATPIILDLGTGAPPNNLGGIGVVHFPNDPAPSTFGGNPYVNGAPSPGLGFMNFSVPAWHYNQVAPLVPGAWQTWSNGYTGDVYSPDAPGFDDQGFNAQALYSMTFFLPANTFAFYLYAQPDQLAQTLRFRVSAPGAVDVFGDADGNGGARGFGVYDLLNPLSTVTLSIDGIVGVAGPGFGAQAPSTVTQCAPDGAPALQQCVFGVGEFGSNAIPEPATVSLLGLGLVGMVAAVRRRAKK